MMAKVNMHEAKTHLSRLVRRALEGEEIVIAKAGKELVKLTPVEPMPRRKLFGIDEGKVWMAPDFDELPADIQKYFDGEAED